MLYSIVGEDIENNLSARQTARPAHLARLEALQNAGRLIIAGPNPAIDSNDPATTGFTGSIIIAEFDSFEDAKAWANLDHYISAGVYQNVTVKPFKQAFQARSYQCNIDR